MQPSMVLVYLTKIDGEDCACFSPITTAWNHAVSPLGARPLASNLSPTLMPLTPRAPVLLQSNASSVTLRFKGVIGIVASLGE